MSDLLATARARLAAQQALLDRGLHREVIRYALSLAGDGLDWLRRWSAGEEDARAELQEMMER